MTTEQGAVLRVRLPRVLQDELDAERTETGKSMNRVIVDRLLADSHRRRGGEDRSDLFAAFADREVTATDVGLLRLILELLHVSEELVGGKWHLPEHRGRCLAWVANAIGTSFDDATLFNDEKAAQVFGAVRMFARLITSKEAA